MNIRPCGVAPGCFLALMLAVGAGAPPAEAIGLVNMFSLACIVGYFAVTAGPLYKL
jgi:hypothetical protein